LPMLLPSTVEASLIERDVSIKWCFRIELFELNTCEVWLICK
jgi:hypothetical protein